MSSTPNLENRSRRDNPIPPWERLGVDGGTAASMMGCGRSTFFARVKAGMYPKPAADGLWNVSQLRECREKMAAVDPEPESAQH